MRESEIRAKIKRRVYNNLVGIHLGENRIEVLVTGLMLDITDHYSLNQTKLIQQLIDEERQVVDFHPYSTEQKLGYAIDEETLKELLRRN